MLQLTNENFEQVYEGDTFVVTFSSPFCGPCRSFAPVLEKLGETGVKVGKVDVSEEEELAIHFGIQVVPTTIIFHKGDAVKKFSGVLDLEGLKEAIQPETTKPCNCGQPHAKKWWLIEWLKSCVK